MVWTEVKKLMPSGKIIFNALKPAGLLYASKKTEKALVEEVEVFEIKEDANVNDQAQVQQVLLPGSLSWNGAGHSRYKS